MCRRRVPKFRALEERNYFIVLATTYYSEALIRFEPDPHAFEATFYTSKFKGKRIAILVEWCDGLLKGARLDADGRKSLKKARPDLLKPMELFGSRAYPRELETGDADKFHRIWSAHIAPAV